MSFIISPSSTAKIDVFTASGTWTKPAGVTFVQVQAWGAGGGGGSGNSNATTSAAGGGGGGGGCTQYTFPASSVSSSVTVTIGAGGAGGAAVAVSSGLVGANGGNTTFGTLLTATGGSGGTLATYNAGGAGGGNGFTAANGYGAAAGAQSSTQGRGNSAEYGGGSGGAGNVSNALWGAGGGNAQWGGGGGAGGCPVNASTGSYALPAGMSSDSLGLVYEGAACGQNGGAGTAGTTQRTIIPVGGGGGGGGSGAQSFGATGRLRYFNSTLIVPTTLGYYSSTDNGTTWSYTGMNGFPVDFCYLGGFWYCLLNRDSIGYLGKGTTLTNMTFTQVAGVITNGTGLATDGVSKIAVMGQYSNYYYTIQLSSDGGATWTQTISSTNNNDGFTYFTYANGFWFISSTFTGVSVYSPDATTGSWVGTSNGIYYKRSYGMCQIGGQYVAAYAGGASNGIWTGATAPDQTTLTLASIDMYDVATSGTIAAAVGNGGAIYTSTDGNTWTSRTSGTTDLISNIVWTGTKFVAMVGQNQLRTYNSTNGTTWTAGTNLTSGAFFNAGAGGAGGLCAGGGGGGGGYTGYNSGAGGLGGNGYMRVYSW